ncbi:MAG: hypothetical protein IJV22_04860 [Bacteroidales bacterium]|nr:hypothetical protein [Bacteroidales bacterium]
MVNTARTRSQDRAMPYNTVPHTVQPIPYYRTASEPFRRTDIQRDVRKTTA